MRDDKIEEWIHKMADDDSLGVLYYEGEALQFWFRIFEDYILRLKSDKEQVGKNTAKKILRDMQLRLLHDYTDEEVGYQYQTIATADIYRDLKEIAEEYAVEVDDE